MDLKELRIVKEYEQAKTDGVMYNPDVVALIEEVLPQLSVSDLKLLRYVLVCGREFSCGLLHLCRERYELITAQGEKNQQIVKFVKTA